MRRIAAAAIMLSLGAGVAAPANAACVVMGWTESGQGQRPIFKCDDEE